MKKKLIIGTLFIIVLIMFASCDMELFANKYLPSTLQGEVTVTVPAGGAKIGTELTAGYDGYEPVEFQWYRNGVPIPGATGKTFTPTEPGSYTVGVKAPTRGEKISHPPIVIKGLEGTIEITPDPPVVDEEVTAEYIPESGEPGPFKYEWLKEEPTGSGNWVTVSDIDKYTPTEPGNYMIVVTDESSGAQTSRTITVPPHPPLSGTVSLTNEPLTAGDSTTATYIPASGESTNPSDYSYQWINPSGTVAGTDATSPTLTAGTWTVRVTGPDGRTFEKQITVEAGGGTLAAGLYRGAPDTITVADLVRTIELVAANFTTNVTSVVNGEPTSEFTLLVDRQLTVGAVQNFNVANAKLTIIGIGGEERIIQNNGVTSGWFAINANNASITLGNNITLRGASGLNTLVYVTNGELIMESGSKITNTSMSESNVFTGAVFVTGSNSVFTMKGGEISGNTYDLSATNAAVYIRLSGTFNMSGGKVVNNNLTVAPTIFPGTADVYIRNDGIFNMSGTAYIGTLLLGIAADNPGTAHSSINLDSALSGSFSGESGGIGNLHLMGASLVNASTVANWVNKQVITDGGAGAVALADFVNNRLGLGQFRTNRATGIVAADAASIAATHHINDSGVLTAGSP